MALALVQQVQLLLLLLLLAIVIVNMLLLLPLLAKLAGRSILVNFGSTSGDLLGVSGRVLLFPRRRRTLVLAAGAACLSLSLSRRLAVFRLAGCPASSWLLARRFARAKRARLATSAVLLIPPPPLLLLLWVASRLLLARANRRPALRLLLLLARLLIARL